MPDETIQRRDQRAGAARPGGAAALLAGVGRRARAVLIGEAWTRSLAVSLAAVAVLVAVDYVFRLPRAVRVIHLAALGVLVFELVRRLVVPAVRFRPLPADVALRIGRRPEAGAEAGERLASGSELAADSGRAGELAAALAAVTGREADEIAAGLRGRSFVRARVLWRSGAVLGAVALVVGVFALVRPDLASIGLHRALWPFDTTEWPRRTAVADATGIDVHPIGEALPMRALLTRTNQPPGRSEVAAVYRVITDGESGPSRRVVLTSQRRTEAHGGAEGELFERLIEPAGQLREDDVIEYRFESADNQSPPVRVRLAERPRVERIVASVSPPGYAAAVAGAHADLSGERLSPDASGVAVVSPVLAGSIVDVRIETSKPARLVAPDERWRATGPTTLRYEAEALERDRIEIELVDEYGLVGLEPVVVLLDVNQDAPAAVTITEPAFDESVLATALVEVRAEARDDLGVDWLELERTVARVPEGSEGGAPEPDGDAVTVASAEPTTPGAVAPELAVRTMLDVGSIGVRAGDEVWLTATGRDLYAAAAPGEVDDRAVRSGVRRLRIIDEETLIEQIRGELAGVRRAAIEIDTAQASLAEGGEQPVDDAPRQDALTDRLEAQREAVERLRDRTARNGLDDETLRGMLTDAGGLVREAAQASSRAAGALQRTEAGDAEQRDEATEAQQQVRENLESLIAMLDRGQDNWVARRTVENLLNEQREIAAETEALGQRTMGRTTQELAPDERTELERIAERQRDAAERARQALDSLSERADELERFDRVQADAMAQAARRGRQEGLSQQMREAAEQLGQNQTQSASQSQQNAAEALEQMLEDIDSADAARDEALRRVLASVLESLERLIEEQDHELDALARTQADGSELAPLAEAMVRLATNTLGVLDQVAGQRDLAGVASLITLAADAQERAVTSLREDSGESADAAERESLARLTEARDEAKRLEEEASQRESARKRAELRTAYREILEQQAALVADTEPWVGAELDRRSRAEVRALGQRQQEIGGTLETLRSETEELADALVFALAHQRMEASSQAAADRLLAANPDAEASRRQETVARLLRSLLEALAEDSQQQQFAQQSGGGGGGGSGSEPPLVPDLAELKLLRAMQAEAMTWTQNVEEAPERPASAEVEELATLQRQLAERAAQLAERLTQQGGPPPPRRPDPTEDSSRERNEEPQR